MAKRLLHVLCCLSAVAAAPAVAEADSVAVAPCTTDAVSLRRYAPCTFGGVVFSDLTATLAGTDLSDAGQVSATSVLDLPAPPLVPVLTIPQPDFLPVPITQETPLEYEFTATAIGGGTLNGVRVIISEAGNFSGLLTLRVETPDGQVFTVTAGTDLNGQPLGLGAMVPLESVSFLRLRATINQAPSLGGSFGFVFGVNSTPDPVPEPGALLLAGTGLAWLARRRTKRVR